MPFQLDTCVSCCVCGITPSFPGLSPAVGQVLYVLRTRSPLSIAAPFDLHVSDTPLAFVLSQDQTLHDGPSQAPSDFLLPLDIPQIYFTYTVAIPRTDEAVTPGSACNLSQAVFLALLYSLVNVLSLSFTL
jgi:hypothetical protein